MRLGEGEGDGKRLERGGRETRGEEEGEEEDGAFHGSFTDSLLVEPR